MDWQDLADVPFAAALTPHAGALAPGTEYDGLHFDQLSFDEPRAASSRFTECAFPNSRLARTDFTRVTMDATDLRSAELGIIVDSTSLRGAIISTAQLVHLAPVLAETLGITVSDA